MSNDLISRKAVLDILTEERVRNSILAAPTFVELLVQRIKKVPTAFDKEKVINDLLNASICPSPDEDSFVELEEAIEIVEKGGIE